MATSGSNYVVVGAGAAGCVLADQLSATGASVVLLEAGSKDRTPNAKIPAAFSKMFKSKHDWNYQTVPQEHLNGRSLYWPRGKILGGSTSMNAMIYQRGHRSTFDGWAADGNKGWSYRDLLPIFMALEDQQRGPSDFHGTGGGLSVSDVRTPNILSQACIDAAIATGFEANGDFNDDTQPGFGMYQVTQRDGVRCSAATAFLKPALSRSNLQVRTGAHVTKVVVDAGKAIGVEWLHKGQVATTYADEVILCGGAVNTPQLLMLSGIGPADHLRSHGIDAIHNSVNVGQNLIDHLACGNAYAIREPITLAHAETLKPLATYLRNKTGPLSSNVGEAGGFVSLGDGPMPDIQFHFAPVYFIGHGFDSPDTDGLTLAPTLVDVKSRGEITLRSSNPLDSPIIDPRYLSDETDQWLLVEGLKLAREFAQQPELAQFIDHEYLPGANCKTDDDWVEHLKNLSETLYHPVGTAAMGPNDSDVVDPALRVRGIEGLRVADASIMPTIVNANTQAIAMVIGKRCAELLA